jgi:alpha-ribazole phosphatase
MVTTLYLVRHGETEGSGAKRYHGGIDVPLSENGIRQVRDASVFIREHLRSSGARQETSYLKDVHRSDAASTGSPNRETMASIYCSDLSRSLKSAEILAGHYGLMPVIMPDLRERSFGIWEGMTFAEIRERYPEAFEAWAGNPVKYSPPGGESTVEVRDRVVRAFDEIIGRHDGEQLAIVAHGGVNRVILCQLLGVPLENIFRIEQGYAAVNIIEFWDRYPVVKLINGGPCE